MEEIDYGGQYSFFLTCCSWGDNETYELEMSYILGTHTYWGPSVCRLWTRLWGHLGSKTNEHPCSQGASSLVGEANKTTELWLQVGASEKGVSGGLEARVMGPRYIWAAKSPVQLEREVRGEDEEEARGGLRGDGYKTRFASALQSWSQEICVADEKQSLDKC